MRFIYCIMILLMSIPLTSAGEWRSEGTPLYVIAEGQVHGGVYVGGGHGLTYEDPYVEYFDLPRDIEYARLYVPMWNYNEDDWIEVSINGESLGNKSVPDYVSAWGVADYVYTVTDLISSGMNKFAVTYHNINGAPYSIVLVAVYKDPAMPQTRFWITEGNTVLSHVSKKDSAEVILKGQVPEEVTNATLWTMMIAGNEGEVDRLYFNSYLMGDDVGRSKSGAYFDLDRWDVREFLISDKNTVRFERGDEEYLHPFNAVLAIEYQQDMGDDFLELYPQAKPTKSSIPIPVIIILAACILFFTYRFMRKK